MPSRDRAPAVQGRGTQAAAVADARASLRRTRARMASLTAYDKDISSGSYNLSSATTGSYYSCVSQVTIGYDAAGPVAIGLTHWKNPYAQGRPTLPSDLPLFISKDAGVPVYHQSLTRKTELATPLSCPASLSITPVPSYSSSSQETLSQDTTGIAPLTHLKTFVSLLIFLQLQVTTEAVRCLLHVAVSDVNDDVRRAAVESLVFVLFRTPEQCPSVVSLLSESCNPHVHYGTATALGICCAGTGNKEAINLLEPMTNDPVNYVRQGALIASALIMIQQTEITCPKVNQFRQLYSRVINDKHDDVMAQFGTILAQGILDAGGHNVTISLQSRTGHIHMPSVVGVLVFTQFWFWFPLSHFLSLAYTPTCVIGLNKDLKMPKVQYKSNCKPSAFVYPALLEVPKEKEKEKVSTAVLSITAKAKKDKGKEKREEEKMEVDEAEKKGEKEKKKEPEPNFQLLDNPA
ncbi:hypothetical protein JEQ12_014715 [Ovis aries]|uniref:26S proteasome regulatory subunit RPN2 C-terminal domain-containing protein n=1 Tax=Ovis aries TaxID=9940 RepID=A0A836D449_SHEEP|nr:hypothetical protein JEQ12_014715 [Ovis aries]